MIVIQFFIIIYIIHLFFTYFIFVFFFSIWSYVAVCHPLRAVSIAKPNIYNLFKVFSLIYFEIVINVILLFKISFQRALCTYGRSKFYVIFCTIFAVLYNLVRFGEIEACGDHHPDYGQIYCTRMTTLRTSTAYIKYFIHWSSLVVNHIIPFTGLLVFNTMIYAQVRKANRERQMWSRTERREIGLATMLLGVVVVFIVFNSAALYINFVEAFFVEIQLEIVIISNLLVTLNSSVNFIIYVIFGEKFKRIFLQLFCEGRTGRESPDGIMQEDSSYSNGDGNRNSSSRLSRHGTQRTSLRNGTSLKIKRIHRIRAPTQDPCVYYPARDITRSTEITKLSDWEKNGNITSDLL